MKKTLFIILLGLGITQVNAQNVEITPLYGYQFGTKLDYFGGYVKMEEGSMFGGTVGFNTGRNVIPQISYMRQTAEIRLRDVVVAPTEVRVSDANFDWIGIGVIRTAGTDELYGHFGLGVGLLVSTPTNTNTAILEKGLNSSSRMFFDFKFGGTAMFNENIGLRIQALFQFPVDWGGAYFGYGTGGPSTGVSFSSSSTIFSLNGGLVFVIPQ